MTRPGTPEREFLLAADEDAVTVALDALADTSGGEGQGRVAGRALIDSSNWEW